MTLNGVMAIILRYFSEFAYLPGVLRKSSRSLSHLLMSSCFTYCTLNGVSSLQGRVLLKPGPRYLCRALWLVSMLARCAGCWRTFNLREHVVDDDLQLR